MAVGIMRKMNVQNAVGTQNFELVFRLDRIAERQGIVMKKKLVLSICLVMIVFCSGCTESNNTINTAENSADILVTSVPDERTLHGSGITSEENGDVLYVGVSEKKPALETAIRENGGSGKVAFYLSSITLRFNKFQIEACMKRNPDRFLYKLFPVNTTYDLNSDVLDEFVNKGLEAIEDPKVKAFFMYYTPFADELFAKIKECRPDIVIIVTGRIDDEMPDSVDIILAYDEVGMIKKQVKQAQSMGTETFLYISNVSDRLNEKDAKLEEIKISTLKNECKSRGIEYIQKPPIMDAMGPGGEISDSVRQHGENISFFSLSGSYIDWLDHLPIEYNYIFVQQDDFCPDYTRLASYLGVQISVNDYPNDYTWLRNQIKEKMAEQAQPGRYAMLSAPFNVVSITAAIEYGLEYSNGKTNGKVDIDVLRESFEKACEIHGFADADFEINKDEQYDNHFLFSTDYVVY